MEEYRKLNSKRNVPNGNIRKPIDEIFLSGTNIPIMNCFMYIVHRGYEYKIRYLRIMVLKIIIIHFWYIFIKKRSNKQS